MEQQHSPDRGEPSAPSALAGRTAVVVALPAGEDPGGPAAADLLGTIEEATGREPVLAPDAAGAREAAERLLAGSGRGEGPGGSGGVPATSALVLVPGGPPEPARRGASGRVLEAAVEPLLEAAAPGTGEGPERALLSLLLSAEHPRRGLVVAVTPSRGGLGATTLVLHLARAWSARGRAIAVVDADPAGALGWVLGEEAPEGIAWGSLPTGERAFRPERLAAALPEWQGARIVTGDSRGGPVSPEDARPVIEALAAVHDVVLVDLPRGEDAPEGARVLLLAGTDLPGALAAEALAPRYRDPAHPERLALVARQCADDVTVEELEAMVQAPALAVLPEDRALRRRAAHGDDPTRGRGGARRCAREIVDALDPRVPEALHGASAQPRLGSGAGREEER